MKVADLHIMSRWIFPEGNPVELSRLKICPVKPPKKATLIFDEKSKPKMLNIYWLKHKPIFTKINRGFIKMSV